MPTYALDCEFDGSGFAGTALQAEQRTVQGVLRRALAALHDGPVLTRAAGRLDAGVSARSLVLSTPLPRLWDPVPALGLALNACLPEDLVVTRVAAVPAAWDALACCTAKTYRYRVLLRPARPACDRHCHWLYGPVDEPSLHHLAAALVGEHDLAAFACLRRDPSDAGDARRRITAAAWERVATDLGPELRFRISGSGFLYKQVRGLVGGMLAVATGSATVAQFHAAMRHGRVRDGAAERRVGQIAPACGLRLESASFAPEPEWWELR